MRTTFDFRYDAGHGWLIVTRAALLALHITEDDVSPYSYAADDLVALEEDCDACLFIGRYKAQHGRRPDINEIDDGGSSPVRGWSAYGKRRAFDPVHIADIRAGIPA